MTYLQACHVRDFSLVSSYRMGCLYMDCFVVCRELWKVT